MAVKRPGEPIDLSKAVVVVPDGLSGPENKATRLLVEEVRNRSGLEWNVSLRWPKSEVPVIAVGPARLFDTFPRELKEQLPGLTREAKEGYRIQTSAAGKGPPVLAVIGNDERGVLFGVGRLLRELRLGRGRVGLAGGLNLASAPKYPSAGTSWLSAQDQLLRRAGTPLSGSDTSATWPSSAPTPSS